MGVVGRGWLAAEAIHMEIHTTQYSPASPAYGGDGMGRDMKANVTPAPGQYGYLYIYRERGRGGHPATRPLDIYTALVPSQQPGHGRVGMGWELGGEPPMKTAEAVSG